MNRATCDRHSRYRAGCVECAKRSSIYYNERAACIAQTGTGFSHAVDLTAQRIQELRAAGWSLTELGERTGIDWHHLSELTRPKRSNNYVTLRVFGAVDRVYRELRDFPGPSSRARTWATKQGWTPPPALPVPDEIPEDSVDEVAVARAVKGERMPLTRAEILEAWRRLEGTGLSTKNIGQRLHVSPRTVERWRAGEYKPISKRTA